MNEVFWHVRTSSTVEILASLGVPFLIFFVQYQLDYAYLLVRHFLMTGYYGGACAPVAEGKRPGALLVIPTMLRSRDELEGLKDAAMSAAKNDTGGELTIVIAIDDGRTHAGIYRELEQWAASYQAPEGVRVLVTCTPERTGKACAIDAAVEMVEGMVASGEMKELPPIFFNMDADSELGPKALVRMIDRLTTPSWIAGAKPRLVTSNVAIAKEHFWFGWRGLFTVRGQIAIQVAREYLTAIAIGKFNTKIMPVMWASGALYCTWTKLHIDSPRWGAFMQTLTVGDWIKWWLGFAPPSFANAKLPRLPEAQTGPGDDTWMTWMACCARWKGDELVTELPRTPAHAAWYTIYDYFVRPVRHEPQARIMTRSPTTVTALFKQRIRWNTSRIQDVQRWTPALAFHWSVGIPAAISTSQLVFINLAVLFSLLVWPFSTTHSGMTAFVTALGLNIVLRFAATLMGVLLDRPNAEGNALKLLAVPLSLPYHMFFNVIPTIIGSVKDIFLFGVNTKFSPEKTHIRSGTTRIALAFRIRRALTLAVRSIIFSDVPLGWFWLGWHETPWTPNGFEGWTSGKPARAILPPLRKAKTAPAEVVVAETATAEVAHVLAAVDAIAEASAEAVTAHVADAMPEAAPTPAMLAEAPITTATATMDTTAPVPTAEEASDETETAPEAQAKTISGITLTAAASADAANVDAAPASTEHPTAGASATNEAAVATELAAASEVADLAAARASRPPRRTSSTRLTSIPPRPRQSQLPPEPAGDDASRRNAA